MQTKGVNWSIFVLLAILLIGAGAWRMMRPAANTASKPADDKTITVITGGDINLGRQTGQKILAGDIGYPFANMGDTLKTADIAFVNLESQLVDLGGVTQSPTNDYQFAGPPEGAQSLANAGIDIVSVANNHMWDYGKKGLESTLAALDAVNVKHVGASLDSDKLFTPVITEVKGKKIAWFAMTNVLNGYENSGAANYIAFQNGAKLIEQIKAVKDSVDWVFVSIHSGAEYAAAPSDALVKMAHDLIDAGADAVFGHHPHVPQKIEVYNGKPIFYSLGNFAFWQPFSFWTENSFLAKLKLTEPHKVEYETIPIQAGWQPSLLTDEKMVEQLYSRLNSTG